jgi:hypothetical protein
VHQRALQRDAEARRDPLGVLGAERRLADGRLVAAGPPLDVQDARQRELIGDEGVVDRQRRGKKRWPARPCAETGTTSITTASSDSGTVSRCLMSDDLQMTDAIPLARGEKCRAIPLRRTSVASPA